MAPRVRPSATASRTPSTPESITDVRAGSMRSARTTRATTWSSRMVERRLATTPPGAFYPYNDDGASATALTPPSDHGARGARREKHERGRLRGHQRIALVVDRDGPRTGRICGGIPRRRIARRRIALRRIADRDPIRVLACPWPRIGTGIVVAIVLVFHLRRLERVVSALIVRLVGPANASREDDHGESDGHTSNP